jgi:hypothetical protein
MRNKLPGKPEEWDFDFFYATFGCYRDPAESREGVNTINEMERSLNRLAQEAFGDHLMNPLKGYVTRHRRLQRAAFVTPEREAVLLEVVGAAKESISQGTKPPAKKGGRS